MFIGYKAYGTNGLWSTLRCKLHVVAMGDEELSLIDKNIIR